MDRRGAAEGRRETDFSITSSFAIPYPSASASAITRVTRLTARIASSLPGITKSTSSGSQFVSTIAITGMSSFLASVTAICSFFVSTTKTASGRRSRAWIPPRFRSSFSRSCWRRITSFFGRLSIAPDDSISRNSRRRIRRREIVVKFVSIPPSQRWFTNGIPTRFACSSTTSCACFLVPMNRTVPRRRPRSRTNSCVSSIPSRDFSRSMM